MIPPMRLSKWLADKGRGAKAELQRVSGVSYTTIQKAERGIPIRNYAVAQKLSEATGGDVSVRDLCDPATGAA